MPWTWTVWVIAEILLHLAQISGGRSRADGSQNLPALRRALMQAARPTSESPLLPSLEVLERTVGGHRHAFPREVLDAAQGYAGSQAQLRTFLSKLWAKDSPEVHVAMLDYSSSGDDDAAAATAAAAAPAAAVAPPSASSSAATGDNSNPVFRSLSAWLTSINSNVRVTHADAGRVASGVACLNDDLPSRPDLVIIQTVNNGTNLQGFSGDSNTAAFEALVRRLLYHFGGGAVAAPPDANAAAAAAKASSPLPTASSSQLHQSHAAFGGPAIVALHPAPAQLLGRRSGGNLTAQEAAAAPTLHDAFLHSSEDHLSIVAQYYDVTTLSFRDAAWQAQQLGLPGFQDGAGHGAPLPPAAATAAAADSAAARGSSRSGGGGCRYCALAPALLADAAVHFFQSLLAEWATEGELACVTPRYARHETYPLTRDAPDATKLKSEWHEFNRSCALPAWPGDRVPPAQWRPPDAELAAQQRLPPPQALAAVALLGGVPLDRGVVNLSANRSQDCNKPWHDSCLAATRLPPAIIPVSDSRQPSPPRRDQGVGLNLLCLLWGCPLSVHLTNGIVAVKHTGPWTATSIGDDSAAAASASASAAAAAAAAAGSGAARGQPRRQPLRLLPTRVMALPPRHDGATLRAVIQRPLAVSGVNATTKHLSLHVRVLYQAAGLPSGAPAAEAAKLYASVSCSGGCACGGGAPVLLEPAGAASSPEEGGRLFSSKLVEARINVTAGVDCTLQVSVPPPPPSKTAGSNGGTAPQPANTSLSAPSAAPAAAASPFFNLGGLIVKLEELDIVRLVAGKSDAPASLAAAAAQRHRAH